MIMSPAKAAEPIVMPFRMGFRSPMGTAILRGKKGGPF